MTWYRHPQGRSPPRLLGIPALFYCCFYYSYYLLLITYAMLHFNINNLVRKQVNLFFLSYFITHLFVYLLIN